MIRNAMIRAAWLMALISLGARCMAQDASTTLLLRFENTLQGAQGETPVQASGVEFADGMQGRCAVFGYGDQLKYVRSGNIDPTVGTLEFWLRSDNPGNDGQAYVLLACGGGGGMLFCKDGGNFLRSIFNRYGVGGQSEYGTGTYINNWPANQWHHVAYTWSTSAKRLRIYVDGILKGESSVSGYLPAIPDTTFQIGAEGFGTFLYGLLDELRISSVERTAEEVAQSYLSGLTISSLTSDPTSLVMYETWRRTPSLTATTNLGTVAIPPSGAVWSTSNEYVATVDASGQIRAVHQGNAVIRATVGSAHADIAVQVKAPIRPPEYVTVLDPFLTSPAAGYRWEMPVAVIRYIPTKDGVTVDSVPSGYWGSVNNLVKSIGQMELETKFMLEEGSRFRGYKDPLALPSLGYRVVAMVNVYEELPPDMAPNHAGDGSGWRFPDYYQILERFNARHWVEDLGVKEIWLWGYHYNYIAPAESNMSSPTTGDVSNSYRWNDDLPVFNKTYVLYNYNYTRTAGEAVHNHGHQLESILSYADWRQNNSNNLFWKSFAGRTDSWQVLMGRCGDCHHPPNTTQDYDYYSTTLVSSDIEDWNPAGTGQHKLVNAYTWANIPYAWPYGRDPGDSMHRKWYIYWMQAMPGRENAIPYGAGFLTDWWYYTADWDAAVQGTTSQVGLWAPAATLSGKIVLEDCINPVQPIEIELRPESGSRVLSRSFTLGADGKFSLSGLPRGRYAAAIKAANWLRRVVPADLSAGDCSTIDVSLKNGDVDGDNAVTVFDYNVLSDAFDSTEGDSNWDARADLDRDGIVTVFDYNILSQNFDMVGD